MILNDSELKRFLRGVVKHSEPDNECWVWVQYRTHDGYGLMKFRGSVVRVHRLAFQVWKGDIPDSLTVHHLCYNTSCCNPTHLELRTKRDNILDGESASATNARKTHCINGHLLSDDNVYRYTNSTRRRCKVCAKEQERNKYHRNK